MVQLPRPRVLVVLPDAAEAAQLARRFEPAGWHAEPCDAASALDRLAAGEAWDALLADPAAGALELLERARGLVDGPAVVLLAGFGTIRDAVEAVRQGARDYLSRPVSGEQVQLALTRALEQRQLRRENLRLRESLDERVRLGGIESSDARMRRIAEVLRAVADTRANVLITGESGTGKTLLARTLHQLSGRAAGPFVVVDCGALPAGLLESELFGHVRGAFTGALRDRAGVFEAARGGTLLLDEIGNAPPELQIKLLRVVQERVLERVGDTRTIEVDVRLVSATNTDLARAVQEGRFREDLYYRLDVVRLEVPPLRERPADIALLAERFVRRFASEHGRPQQGLHPDALALLCAQPWPGNVRQLENALERAVLLGTGPRVLPADLGLVAPEPAPPVAAAPVQLVAGRALKAALDEPERQIILAALERNGWSRQRTARMLGINRTTLFNKMRKHGLLQCAEAREHPGGASAWPPGSPAGLPRSLSAP